jgi:excinuclease UvrABC nuclease subunit
VADGKLYRKGMLDFKADIAMAEAALDFERDPEALDKREQLHAMSISCDAVIRFAERHAELAEVEAARTKDDVRRRELLKAFGGLQGVRQASVEDLAKVHGISRQLAEEIYERMNPGP